MMMRMSYRRPWYKRLSLITSGVYLWFITIPATGVATKQKEDGTYFHASRGQRGSVYATQDGQHYIRTGNMGTIRIGKALGSQLMLQQKKARTRAIVKRAAAATTAVTTLAAAVTALLSLST